MWITLPQPERVKSARAAPSSAGDVTRGRVLIWGLVFGLYIWLGGLAVGVSGATAFVFGAVAGFLIFIYVMVYGTDVPRRQPRRRAGRVR